MRLCYHLARLHKLGLPHIVSTGCQPQRHLLGEPLEHGRLAPAPRRARFRYESWMILAVCKNLLKCERRFLCERHTLLARRLPGGSYVFLIASRRHE